MGRRALLRSVALAAAGLAGCQVIGGESETDREYTPTVRDHLAVAVGTLNTVALAVREYRTAGEPGEATFDPQRPRDRLAAARDALDSARERADSGDERADLAAAGDYADAVEKTVETVVGLDDAGTELETARSILDADEVDTEEATGVLEAARKASSAAVAAQKSATRALERADADRLRDLDAEYDGLRSGLETLRAYVVGVDALAVGYGDQVTGIGKLQSAQDSVDRDGFDRAGEAFRDARSAFEAAATAFDGAAAAAAESLVDDVERGRTRSRALGNLAGGYVSLLAARDRLLAADASIEDEAYEAARDALSEGSEATATASGRFATGAARTDEFADEFDAARSRATAVGALADGYRSLLDARDHVTTAESRIDAEEFDAARSGLEAAGADATAADETFASGQAATADLVAAELETARSRARAVDSLTTGYVRLIDAREAMVEGTDDLDAREFDAAERRFDAAAARLADAETAFSRGRASADGEFTAEFDAARCRVDNLRSAVSQFQAAVDAGENGDPADAERARDDAQAAVDRAREC